MTGTSKNILIASTVFAVLAVVVLCAQVAPPSPRPDERYKADILLVVAHPDDETEITGYLARAIYDQHRRVAVIFGTRGNGGGDAESLAQAAALSEEREIEARKALASFGVMNVWFLDGSDTPGQDVLRSLETWNHGAALWKAVRIMRLTRPIVVMTWMPKYVAGENHGDHQAAGVIATEAFDLAGDPTFFPEQVAAPRDYVNIGNLTEGLEPWQPQKLYFFSDATNQDFMNGKGPEFSTLDKSPLAKPYYQLVAEEMAFHLTQSDTGQFAQQAIAKGDLASFKTPVHLLLGKSLVKTTVTGDPFEGTTPNSIAYAGPPAFQAENKERSYLELGGPFAFYRSFWQTHKLPILENLLPAQVEVGAGSILHIPLVIHSVSGQTVGLKLSLPEGWHRSFHSYDHFDRYPVGAGGQYPLTLNLQTANEPTKEFQKITITALAGGQTIGSVTMLARLTAPDSGLPE
jgi:LmbE family N-acetylglucosaminyl deacetylase